MWFVNSIPKVLKQHIVVDSIDCGRQLLSIHMDLEWEGEELRVLIPYPFTCCKKNGSLEILGMEGVKSHRLFNRIKDYVKLLQKEHKDLSMLPTFSDIEEKYIGDDIGLLELVLEKTGPTHHVDLSVKFKIHYSSCLYVPVMLSNYHSINPNITIETTIEAKHCVVPTHIQYYTYTYKNGVYTITPEEGRTISEIYDRDLYIDTTNWESSDDEHSIGEDEDPEAIKDFMEKVGIVNHQINGKK